MQRRVDPLICINMQQGSICVYARLWGDTVVCQDYRYLLSLFKTGAPLYLSGYVLDALNFHIFSKRWSWPDRLTDDQACRKPDFLWWPFRVLQAG